MITCVGENGAVSYVPARTIVRVGVQNGNEPRPRLAMRTASGEAFEQTFDDAYAARLFITAWLQDLGEDESTANGIATDAWIGGGVG